MHGELWKVNNSGEIEEGNQNLKYCHQINDKFPFFSFNIFWPGLKGSLNLELYKYGQKEL